MFLDHDQHKQLGTNLRITDPTQPSHTISYLQRPQILPIRPLHIALIPPMSHTPRTRPHFSPTHTKPHFPSCSLSRTQPAGVGKPPVRRQDRIAAV